MVFGPRCKDETFRSNKYLNVSRKMHCYRLLVLFSSVCICCCNDMPMQKYVSTSGHVILGGLFPIHELGSGGERCGRIDADRGIQRAEAMLFAVDEINNSTSLLPGIELGTNIRDTCSQDTFALEQSLEFVRASLNTYGDCTPEMDNGTKTRVAGAIGGSDSDVSIQVANLLRLFEIPQISYASTSAKLSDTSRYDFFARTVPPDTLQAKAIADIIALFNWTYVSTVASEGQYGESGIDKFEKEATARNICIAVSEEIPANADEASYDNIVRLLKKKENAKVVVLFTTKTTARNILEAFKRSNSDESFILIASDGWGGQENPVKNNKDIAAGAITIELQTKNVRKFDEYFLNLTPIDNVRNPWFQEFWDAKYKCLSSGNETSNCTAMKMSRDDHSQEKKIQFVIDAVYAFAHAVDKMQRDYCPNTTRLCDAMQPMDGKELFDYILNASFLDPVGSEVRFDSRGDGLGRYDIMNYQRNVNTGDYEYVNVGQWSTKTGLKLDPYRIVFNSHVVIHDKMNLPQSECSEPCNKGEYKKVQEERCCWTCIKCVPWAYLRNPYTCVECLEGFWPNAELSGCKRIKQDHTTIWEFHGLPATTSLVGIFATFAVIFVFLKHNDTPIVKASSRELSYLLLFGILLCYSMTFILLARPSPTICSLQRIGLGVAFCVCYSALLTRTNRISRIFNSAARSAGRPKYISPKSQLVICFLLISVQLFAVLIWLVVHPPMDKVKISEDRSKVWITCSISDIHLVISLSYDMFLIALCTVYAFKSRKIPENFNEAKFIAFTMYTTCVIWLAFLPVFLVTNEYFKIQTTTLCISVSLSATVALCCLFVPKVYIIVFQPHKNIRSLRTSSSRWSYPERSNATRKTNTDIEESTNSHLKPTTVHNGKDQNLHTGQLTVTFNATSPPDVPDTDVETSQAFL